ncbi:hypothetical protein EU528_03100 [Candidatus Thorarchaeota archaeon]|nr:MAG: hypothetical protein EU528_03100 [Candidatus Thorarchaeota archaeon]
MKRSVAALVIVNTACGFIQIALVFLVQPLGYLLIPLLSGLGFLAGYKAQQKGPLKQDGNQTSLLVILFLVNCAYFLLIGIFFLYARIDSFLIGIMIINMSLITFSNFEELGKTIAYIRNKPE